MRLTPIDAFPTETSQVQAQTEAILLKHIPNGTTKERPTLHKNSHVQFLARNLIQGFPERYTSQDASQPWLMFWTLQGFSLLQVALDPGNKQRAIDTIMAWQHLDGGFGGGPGQSAHLLPTYAAVCSLAIAGRPGPEGGWDQIDRDKLYKFFMSLKQPDGSFLVSHHAEVDVRGIYCLLVTAVLLNIITPELVEGTAAFIASCQTYEGGFSSSSQPYYSEPDDPSTLLSSPRPALGEAHGGYTFCALASWVILQPYINHMPESSRPSINLRTLLRWLVQMQGIEAELGGFKGRTNKLVDGCYSWWVGGCFALLGSLGIGVGHTNEVDHTATEVEEDTSWDDVDDTLFNRKILQEYILFAGQHPAGGLRDKPPKTPDAYHTLYCLSGLSAAQHRMMPSLARQAELKRAWRSSTSKNDAAEQLHKEIFIQSLSWTEEAGASKIVGEKANSINATHPIFNLTVTHSEGMMAYFYNVSLLPRPFRAPPPSSAR